MSGDYRLLASIYDQVGMADYAAQLTPTLVDYTQRKDLLGRRVLDAGCGTGVTSHWLAEHSYTVIGMDKSPQMLAIAQNWQTDVEGVSLRWLEGDLLTIDETDLHSIDTVLALDVVNELASLRELETAFRHVYDILDENRQLIFDLHTIQGLVNGGLQGQQILYDDREQLTVILDRRYDYERQEQSSRFLIYKRFETGWQRVDALRTLRGFPVQAVTALLQRCGFRVVSLLDDQLEPYDISMADVERVIIIARKRREKDS